MARGSACSVPIFDMPHVIMWLNKDNIFQRLYGCHFYSTVLFADVVWIQSLSKTGFFFAKTQKTLRFDALIEKRVFTYLQAQKSQHRAEQLNPKRDFRKRAEDPMG
jgi:hypothetical protein